MPPITLIIMISRQVPLRALIRTTAPAARLASTLLAVPPRAQHAPRRTIVPEIQIDSYVPSVRLVCKVLLQGLSLFTHLFRVSEIWFVF